MVTAKPNGVIPAAGTVTAAPARPRTSRAKRSMVLVAFSVTKSVSPSWSEGDLRRARRAAGERLRRVRERVEVSVGLHLEAADAAGPASVEHVHEAVVLGHAERSFAAARQAIDEAERLAVHAERRQLVAPGVHREEPARVAGEGNRALRPEPHARALAAGEVGGRGAKRAVRAAPVDEQLVVRRVVGQRVDGAGAAADVVGGEIGAGRGGRGVRRPETSSPSPRARDPERRLRRPTQAGRQRRDETGRDEGRDA